MENNNSKKETSRTKQSSYRLQNWIYEKISELAKEKNITRAEMINYLLEDELNFLGYTKLQYESKKLNLGRTLHSASSPIKKEA